MSERFVLNETSYFGKDARKELGGEIKKRGFKKVFLVSDKSLVKAGVTLNRKALSNMAIEDPVAFKAVVEVAKNAVKA